MYIVLDHVWCNLKAKLSSFKANIYLGRGLGLVAGRDGCGAGAGDELLHRATDHVLLQGGHGGL